MKKTFVVSLLIAGLYLQAQSIGNSPYAAYGIGDIKYDNTVDVASMGGISTAYIWDFNNNFNFKNPAANTNLELANIKIEGINENNFYKTDYHNTSATKHSTYLSNIAISMPFSKKVKFGLGFQPYSSKQYEVVRTSTSAEGVIEGHKYKGSGNLNTVQAALGYQITPSFALGLRSNYYFGKLHDVEEVTFSDAELVSGYANNNKINSFNFTLGSTFQKKLANDHKITVGATYTFGTTGQLESVYQNSTYYPIVGGGKGYETLIDQKETYDKKFLPQEFSLGLGYGSDTKWFVGTQLDYKKGENFNYLGQVLHYNDSYKISAGGWILPNYNNFRNYFSRVIYRYGAYYEKGAINIGGKDINKFALTGGVTLPFQKSNVTRMNSIDLGLEIGRRGTLQNNLIQQNFVNVKIGINFADKWFGRRLYN